MKEKTKLIIFILLFCSTIRSQYNISADPFNLFKHEKRGHRWARLDI